VSALQPILSNRHHGRFWTIIKRRLSLRTRGPPGRPWLSKFFFVFREPIGRIPALRLRSPSTKARGDNHVQQHHTCRIATHRVVLRAGHVDHTSHGPRSSYPRGFGYKGQITSGLYERREIRNNRDGPAGEFYVRSPHWR